MADTGRTLTADRWNGPASRTKTQTWYVFAPPTSLRLPTSDPISSPRQISELENITISDVVRVSVVSILTP